MPFAFGLRQKVKNVKAANPFFRSHCLLCQYSHAILQSSTLAFSILSHLFISLSVHLTPECPIYNICRKTCPFFSGSLWLHQFSSAQIQQLIHAGYSLMPQGCGNYETESLSPGAPWIAREDRLRNGKHLICSLTIWKRRCEIHNAAMGGSKKAFKGQSHTRIQSEGWVEFDQVKKEESLFKHKEQHV